MNFGLYEQIINKAFNDIDENDIQVEKRKIDKENAPRILSNYLSEVLEKGLKDLSENNYTIEEQLNFCNYLITKIKDETKDEYYSSQLISKDAEMLYSLMNKKNSIRALKTDYPIRPNYSIAEPFVFTGANTEIQLLSELKKEISSCDEIDFIVSFIKWSGIVRLLDELKEFTDNGGKLRIITTTYTGATEAKAIERLCELNNTEIKISYNTKQTRLHAKSYIFKRKTGFSTAYVGSSNISSAALTSGTEWNVKVTEKEMKDVYDKICGTFEVYWNSEEFEKYNKEDNEKLRNNLYQEKHPKSFDLEEYNFDITPYPYQERVLEKLRVERENRGYFRNLVVAATGTGKTVMSAFDFKRYLQSQHGRKVKFLFVAHREEILKQSLKCFRGILRDNNFGELMVGGILTKSIDSLFVSIQTFNSKKLYEKLAPDFYDYIIVDEFHHAAAEGYQKLLSHFKPKILLGLTATPERMDGKDILQYFDGKISAEIRLPEAIDRNLLVPFTYFGVSDETDLSSVKWTRGGYDIQELSNVLSFNKARAITILKSLNKYLNDIDTIKGLGFCVSQQHAQFMAKVFNDAGIPSIELDSNSSKELRENVKDKLVKGEIKFIFVVDLYNEGVDIPEVNTVLFLRPTDSLTVFLQQLGRGLRLCEGKDSLTVLDYVGQANKKYRYADKYQALLGVNAMSVSTEIKNGFPNLPKGCFITLEKKAQEYVLNNIKQSFNNKANFIEKFKNFESDSGLVLNYKNFFEYYNINPAKLYNIGLSFTSLRNSNVVDDDKFLTFLARCTQINSSAWIKRLLDLLPKIKNAKHIELTEYDKRCLLMLHYTFETQKSPKDLGCKNVIESIEKIVKAPYYEEIIDLLNYNFSKIDIVNSQLIKFSNCPLELYSAYSNAQILAGFGEYTESRYFPLTSGVWYIENEKTDIFFVTLNKSEKHYAPEVKYEDYSINDKLFHWQSQNKTDINSPTGQRYINHKKTNNNILLCVRNYRGNEYGNTENYSILGYCDYVSHEGSRPISIVWKMHNKIPAKFIERTSKLMVN